MKRAALYLALACAGCTPQADPVAPASTAHWHIALITIPAMPRQLDPTQLTVHVTDSGKPVSGANVRVLLSMPAMDMGRNEVTAPAQSAGTYTATGRFTMPGVWQIAVQADEGKLHQTQTFPVTVR